MIEYKYKYLDLQRGAISLGREPDFVQIHCAFEIIWLTPRDHSFEKSSNILHCRPNMLIFAGRKTGKEGNGNIPKIIPEVVCLMGNVLGW